MRARLGLVAAFAMAAALAPSTASASQVGIDYYWDEGFGGYVPEYVAAPGELNNVTVSITETGGKIVTFHDPTATISADAAPSHTDYWGITHEDSHCTVTDAHTASCVLPDPRWMQQDGTSPTLETTNAAAGKILAIRTDLGDGDDTYTPAASQIYYQLLYGGSGRDVLTTGPGGGTADAGPGNDTIFAGNGVFDWVKCGDGGDRVPSRDADDDIEPDCDIVAAP